MMTITATTAAATMTATTMTVRTEVLVSIHVRQGNTSRRADTHLVGHVHEGERGGLVCLDGAEGPFPGGPTRTW